MNAFLPNLELVFGWLLEASWQASVLALIVITIQRVFWAKLNPRWRYALWLLVVLRLMLPALPESALSLFQFAPPPPTALTVSVTEPLFAAPDLPMDQAPVAVPPPARSFSFYSLLAITWLAGAFGLLALTVIVNRRFARQVANSPEIDDPELLRLFAEAKEEFRVRRPIRLIENGQVQSPAVMGLFQPTLLLPVNVREKFDARELRFIFLHELAHLKRGDIIVQALIALLQILHWFNPVLWFAFRRMRIDREPATDALVLSRTGEDEKERYGLMLIKLLEHFNQRHSLATLVGILEDKDQFKRRFSLIARFTRGAYGWSLLGVVLIGVLALAGLTKSKADQSIRRSHPEDPLPPASECAAWLSKYTPGERETLGRAFDVADGFLAAMDSRKYPGPPFEVDGVMHFKPEAWPAYVDGVHAQFGEAIERHLKSIGSSGPSTEADLVHDVSVTYEGTFRKGNADVTVRELVAMTRIPRYDPQGHWKVGQFVLSVKGPSGDFVYPRAIRKAWAWADAAAHGAFAAAPEAEVKTMPATLTTSMAYQLPVWVAFHSTPGTHPDLDQALIDVVRDGRTDKVGAGDADKVRELLGQGASANAKDGQGNSALTWALNFGKDDAAQALIKAGADGRAEDSNGENAAWLAAKIYHCLGALDLLMREGVDVRGVNKQGQTILVAMMRVHAAQAGKMNYLNDRVWTADEFANWEARERRTVEVLEDAGVDFNGKDGATTPLMAAAQGGHAGAIRALLAHGANTTFKDADGHTALDLAQMFHPELVPPLKATSPAGGVTGTSQAQGIGSGSGAGIVGIDPKKLKEDILAAKEDADARRVLLNMVKDLPDDKFVTTLAALGRPSPEVTALEIEIEQKMAALTEASQTYGSSHPKVVEAQTELEAKQAQMKALTDGLRRAMAIDLQMADSRVRLLSQEVSGTALPPASSSSSDGNTTTSTTGDQIEITCRVAQVEEKVYLADRERIDEAVKKGDIGYLNRLKGMSLLSAPSVTTKPGVRAVVEVTRELNFPVTFDKAKDGTFVPRDFAQKDCGVTVALTPKEVNGKVQVAGTLSLTTFEGFTFNGDSDTKVGSPTFRTTESYVFEEMESGEQIKGVMIPGVQNNPPTEAELTGSAAMAKAAEGTPERLIVFLSARKVSVE